MSRIFRRRRLLMGKIIITKQHNRLLLTLFDGNRPYLMKTAPLLDQEDILGNIYLAKVKDIARGIQGAFLSIGPKQAVYLPMDQCRQALIANREPAKAIQQGDEIVVQVTGEALKSKQPSSSALLTLRGQFCVCNYFGHGLHYSKKLTQEKKELIGSYLEDTPIPGRERYHFTVRTNADNLTDFTLLSQEMLSFIRIFDNITATYRYRTCHTCFYHRETEIINQIKNISLKTYDEIVTDQTEVWKLLSEEFKDKPVRLYQDDMLSLASLYSINTHLQEALGKRVWLSGGGYLVIEPTEALVAIDVNSGKAQSNGKKSSDYYLKVNLEAAKEVARQLRIRNYSGMIMVDFINMNSPRDRQLLMEKLDAYLKEDNVKTNLIDMTALGIVEITRKKVSRPLSYFSGCIRNPM